MPDAPGVGANWQSITSNIDGSLLAAAVGDGRDWGTGGTDLSGNIWIGTGGVGPQWSGMCCATDGITTDGIKFAACNATHIYTSIDSGNTLTKREPGAWRAIACDSTCTNLAAVIGWESTTGNIWLSPDSGVTWTEVTAVTATTPPPADQHWRSITMSSDGSVIAAAIGGDPGDTSSTGTIWISSDGAGDVWTEQTPIPGSRNWQTITTNGDGSKFAAAVGDGDQEPPGDGSGNIWTFSGANNPAEWTGICCNAGGNEIAVCNTTHIYISTNSGATLTQRQAATGQWSAIACSDDFTFQVAAEGYGSGSGSVWLSINNGSTWTEQVTLDGGAAKQWRSVTINNDGTTIVAVEGGNTTNPTSTGFQYGYLRRQRNHLGRANSTRNQKLAIHHIE